MKQRLEQLETLHSVDVNLDTREVFVCSYFDSENQKDEEPGVDFRMATTFVKNLLYLDGISHQPIMVHLICCGGDWSYGLAMYDAIQSVRSRVVTVSHAHARSMSGVIPQAAWRRIIMPNADFLLHLGTLSLSGDSMTAIAEAEKEKRDNAKMIELFASRCHRGPYFRRNRYSKDRVRGWLLSQLNTRREVYLTAREAVDFGFMDCVLGEAGCPTLAGASK